MKKILKGILGFIAIALLVCGLNSFKILKQGEYGIVKNFGKIIRVQNEPGIIFKIPFIESVTTLSQKIQIYDLESSDVMTSDKKSMIADCYTLWKITDPIKFSQSINSMENAESRISVAIYNSMKNTISSTKQLDVISGKDGTLSNTITNNVKDSMLEYGIVIQKVEMKLLDLPSYNKDSVYQRMISERQKIAAQYKAQGEENAQKIRNETDNKVRKTISTAEKDAEILISEGESEYMRIISSAYADPSKQDFYNFLRGLQAAENSFSDDTSIILDDNSPLVGVFNSSTQ